MIQLDIAASEMQNVRYCARCDQSGTDCFRPISVAQSHRFLVKQTMGNRTVTTPRAAKCGLVACALLRAPVHARARALLAAQPDFPVRARLMVGDASFLVFERADLAGGSSGVAPSGLRGCFRRSLPSLLCS